MKTKVVYLLHFEKELSAINHAQHYLGSAINLGHRLKLHAKGASKVSYIREYAKKDISFVLVRTWIGDRQLERKLKNRKNSRALCPLCTEKGRIDYLGDIGCH